jgi:hypothetical protein
MGQGMSDEEREQMARTLEQQFTTRAFYDGLQQQLRVRGREEADRARAARERWHTPGLLTNLGRGISSGLGAAGDAIASPFRDLAERTDRIEEDRAAFERGEQIRRFRQSELIENEHDRRLALDSLHSSDYRRLMRPTGPDPLASGFIDNGRSMNRLGHFFGLSYTPANQVVLLGNQTTRSLFGFNTTYGATDVAEQRLQNVAGAARLIRAGAGRSAEAAGAALAGLSRNNLDAMAVVLKATAKLKGKLPTARAGGLLAAGATGADLFRETGVEALTESGLSRAEAERLYDANAELLGGEMARQIYMTGNQALIEPMEKALEIADRAHAPDRRLDREELAKQFSRNLDELGISGLRKKTIESVRNVLKNTDPKVLALAAAQASGNQAELERLQRSYRRASPNIAQGDSAFIKAGQQASSLFQGQTKEVQEAIAQIGQRGQGNIEQRIREAQATVGLEIDRQAFESTAQHIAEQVGDPRVAGARDTRDLMKRLQGITENALKGIGNEAQRKAIRAWRAAGSDEKGMAAAERAFEDASLDTGARGRVEVFGGGQSGTADINRQLAEVEEQKRKFASDKPDEKAQVLFASSVELFAQAAKDLKAATENMALSNVANPTAREY